MQRIFLQVKRKAGLSGESYLKHTLSSQHLAYCRCFRDAKVENCDLDVTEVEHWY